MLECLTALILSSSHAGDCICCEFMCAMAMPASEDSVSQHSLPLPLVFAFFLLCSLNFGARDVHDIDVPFISEHCSLLVFTL